jgi:serine/threonine-protein kinase
MAMLQYGTQLGRHVIGRLLGAGRRAEVYESTGVDGVPRALKVLEGSVPLGPKARRRFFDEWQVVTYVAHPNVVANVDAGIDDGRAWICTELFRGQSLRQLVRAEGRLLSVERAVDIVRQAAEGVAAAHDLRIVHEDLRPESILVGPGDRVKVADFGLANLGSGSARATVTEKDLAACLYAAPEWLMEKRAATSNDVYALGVVLYELCSGVHPAAGPRMTPIETIRNHLLVAPPPLASLSTPERDLPGDLSDLCARAMAKLPASRCSMRELADGLGLVLARLRALRAPIPVAAAEVAAPEDRRTSEAPPARPARRILRPLRARWPAFAVASAVLALGTLGTGWWWIDGSEEPASPRPDPAPITPSATAPPPARASAARPRAPPPARIRVPPPRPRPPFP